MKKGCKILFLVLSFLSPLFPKDPVPLLLITVSPWEKAGGLESAYIATQNIRQILISSGWFNVILFNQYSPEITQAIDKGLISNVEVSKPESNPFKIGELFGVDIVLWGKITKIVEKENPPQASIEFEMNLAEVKTKQKETFKVNGEMTGEENTSRRLVLEQAIYKACYSIQDKLIARELGNVSAVRKEQAKAVVAEAEKLLEEGKNREAIAKLEEASLIDPGNDSLYVMLGDCYLKLGDYRRAERHYRMAISLSKSNEGAFLGLAKALKARNLKSYALAQLRVLLYFFPQSKEGRLLLAQYLREEGDEEQASQILQKLAREYPDDPSILWEVGQSYLTRRQLTSAFAYLRASFTNQPTPEKAEVVAKLANSLGRYQDTLSILNRWVELSREKINSGSYIKIMQLVDELIDKKVQAWANIRNGIVAKALTKEEAVDTLDKELNDISALRNLMENIVPPSDFKKSFSSRLFALTTLQSAFVSLNSYTEGLGDDKLHLADILIDSAKRDLALARFLEGR